MPEALITQKLRKQANNKATTRKKERRNDVGGIAAQSPDVYKGQTEAYNDQVKRYGLRETAMYKELPNEQIHHIKQVAAFNGLFANTTPDQARQLANKLGSGNLIQNLISVLPSEHQGKKGQPQHIKDMAIHNNLRSKGLERGSKASLQHELFAEMDLAANSSFEYKMHLADRFNKELLPKIKEATDEALTYHARHRGEDTVYNQRRNARGLSQSYIAGRTRKGVPDSLMGRAIMLAPA